MLQGDFNSTAHIGHEELARLIEEARGQGESGADAASLDPHLASCSACREQFEQLLSFERQLHTLRAKSAVPSSGRDACPDPGIWLEIVGGPTPPEQTLGFIKHASQCDRCGPLIQQALAELIDLQRELNDEEKAKIASLQSASPVWQRQLAQRIAGPKGLSSNRYAKPQPSWGESLWWQKWVGIPRLAMAGASLLVVLGVGSWLALHPPLYRSLFRRDQPAAATELLARAYTEKRTIELRFAGAAYGPQRIARGPATSFTDRPTTLSKAEALIATQLESHPSDPAWLQAKGEADLLDGRYDPAVDTLRRALQLEPNSPELLIDLATAYSQRAQQEGRNEDFAAAYEQLSQALRIRADDPVALFNRAIVAEHQFLYHQALADWDQYLRLDQSSQWAQEARMRAEAVREKLKEHQSQAKPLLTPAEVTASLSDSDLASKVDPRIDEYLDQAVLSWLPLAFPDNGTNANSPARRALFFLAELTSRQHSDRWLADLLRHSPDPGFAPAVAALARAFKSNKTGDYRVSGQQATLAEQLFRSSSNTAGELRAQFEQAYAAQMTRRGKDCRRLSIAGGAESERDSYAWLQIQFGLEQGVCSILTGDLGVYKRTTDREQGRAQQAGYGSLYLRALAFSVESKFDTGNRSGGWTLGFRGLEHYWLGQYLAMQGYNLYDAMAYAAEAAGQPNLELAIRREAVATIDGNENPMRLASAHSNMAGAASAAYQPEIAEHEYADAARLLALAPQTEAIRAFRIESEIMTAQLEARQNLVDSALARLTRLQDEVRQFSTSYQAQIFYSTLGEVQLRSHHEAEAEQAFGPALRLAEQNLASLTSEADRTPWSKAAAPIYLGLVQAELVQGHAQESLDVLEWYFSAPQRAGTRSADPSQSIFNPSRLPAPPLSPNQTTIAYGVLSDGLAIWVRDERGLTVKWIPKSPRELQDLAADFYAECSDPTSELSALRRDARSLYEVLIAPVEQQISPGRALVIEADVWLARVPFEVLLDSKDRYLIERSPIVHSLGQDSQARLRSEIGISRDSPALVVGSGASSSADGLIPLPDVAAEADGVARGFHSARVLKSREAALGAVSRALPGTAVFHFAGHALATPGRTGLLLESEDGDAKPPQLMDAAAIRRLQLQNLQLAVLSACNTATGSGGSSGFDSIADALLRTGVPHVVASRWTVDSTEAFMQDFYQNVLSGQTVSGSMRLTSRKMLASPRTSHPYYWSAFAAFGRP